MLAALILASSLSAAPAKPSTGKATAAKPSASKARAGKSPDPAFDSTRAYRYLKEQCAFGPRVAESEAHRKALEYFLAHFRGLGFPTVEQPFVHTDMASGAKVPMTNVIVTITGRESARKPILFCAHWDSRPRADQEKSEMLASRPILGANDGASGIAVLMELANGMKAKAPVQTVYLALFDGEDYGKEGSLDEYFLGARYFAENPTVGGLEYALLLDMVGDRDLHLPIEQNSLKQSPGVVEKIWMRAKELGVSQFEARPGPTVWDDHMPLQAVGIPAVDIIDFDYAPWHTQGDTPDKCSAGSLGAVGRVTASLAYRGLD
ncbi:MAG: M28 family peptidase [Fibrobacteres bacterium]|nr:M28 family peptidase [Fibrobacterota bacterium]